MTQYICIGTCGGVAGKPGVCQAEACPMHNKPLVAVEAKEEKEFIMKKIVKIALIVAVVIFALVVVYPAFSNRSETLIPPITEQPIIPTPTPTPAPPQPVGLLRVCPEQWYVDLMPSTIGLDGTSNEYFVYKGTRRELSEFDVSWVKANCAVKPENVY